jgi:hypothetical protein
MSKNYYEQVESIIDHETGEVTEVKKTVKRRVARDKFIMLYLKDISSIIGLATKSEFKVLMSICNMAKYNSNEVILIKPKKEQIAEETGLNYDNVKNTISRLHKKEILIRTASSTYLLNPKYFFKGEETERAKALKLVFEYTLTDGDGKSDEKV